MGWHSEHRNKSMTNREFFSWSPREKKEIIEDCTVGNTYYAAVKDPETREVSCYVFLTAWDNGEYYNFSYKIMHESVGPCQYNPTKKLLDALTPTDDPYALAWRQKCNAVRQWNSRLGRLEVGDVIVTREPLEFTSGGKYSEFKMLGKRPRRSPVFAPVDDISVGLDLGSRWRSYVSAVRKLTGEVWEAPSFIA